MKFNLRKTNGLKQSKMKNHPPSPHPKYIKQCCKWALKKLTWLLDYI